MVCVDVLFVCVCVMHLSVFFCLAVLFYVTLTVPLNRDFAHRRRYCAVIIPKAVFLQTFRTVETARACACEHAFGRHMALSTK